MKILIVEDDVETREFIARGMVGLGHEVATQGDGREGLFAALQYDYDVLIVDRLLPGMDGLSLVKLLRSEKSLTPVLMLTAIGGIADRVEGLDAGTDDYLVKPFAFEELAARVHALVRRNGQRAEPSLLVVGDIVLDLHRRTVERGGRRVVLQPREFSLLAELMRNCNRVMTRTMLLERVWDFDFDPKTNLVETHMSRLRSKLNAGFDRNAIETIRGSGYMIRDMA